MALSGSRRSRMEGAEVKSKALPTFTRLFIQVALLFIGASILAMGLFYAAGFRGMPRHNKTLTEAKAAAGWVDVAGNHDQEGADADEAESGEMIMTSP